MDPISHAPVPFPTKTNAVHVSHAAASFLALSLINLSQWVAVMPLPDGVYEVQVRAENAKLLIATIDQYRKLNRRRALALALA